jgi:hypothetical protein
MTHSFDAQQALFEIRRRKAITQQKAYLQSRLKKYRAELVSLRKLGASYPELALWLRHEKHIKVTHTTVMRYLAKLPELKENHHAELS